MKRAQRFEGGPGTFKRKIAADHLHDVVGGGNLLNDFLGDARHGWSGMYNTRWVEILASLISVGADRPAKVRDRGGYLD